MQNIEGHKNLYNEGWFVVSSTKEALDYAYHESYVSSSQVWKKIGENLSSNKLNLNDNNEKESKLNQEQSTQLKSQIADFAKNTNENFEKTQQKLKNKSKESIKEAYQNFVIGYMQIQERTADDFRELKNINGNYFGNLKEDFSNYFEIIQDVDKKTENKILSSWQNSFFVADAEFEKEYQNSGQQPNSLLALWSLTKGYGKAVYHAFLKPTAATTAGVVGASFNLAGRFLMNSGKSFYYASRIGYKVVSPTLESGFLSGLALVNYSGEKLVGGTKTGLYIFNQVALVSSEPVYSTGRWLVSTTANTANYAAANIFDVTSGISHIALNQAKAGVVLGYNAVTALPTQTLLACANSVVFLAYDGPRLAVYALRGEINGVPVQEIPVGTVIEQTKAEKMNLQIEKVNDDPTVIKDIIEKSQKD
ncbi:MAG: hypothetical protein ACXVCP_04665 [Bdellovibrio sp.]